MLIEDRFKELLLDAVAAKDFDATAVVLELSRGFDQAMLDQKRAVTAGKITRDERDRLMDRLVEIGDLLDKWEERDTWEASDVD